MPDSSNALNKIVTGQVPDDIATPEVLAEWKDWTKRQRDALREMQQIHQNKRLFELLDARVVQQEGQLVKLRDVENRYHTLSERKRMLRIIVGTGLGISAVGTVLTTALSKADEPFWFGVGIVVAFLGLIVSAVVTALS